MTELLRNKVFYKKERKMMNLHFGRQAVSNSGDTTVSIDNPNTIGNAQEYPVSLYISKMNPFVGDIRG